MTHAVSHYAAFGLTLASELTLPELWPAAPAAPADLAIRFTKVATDGLPGATQSGPLLWTAPGALWLDVPDVARFEVRDGAEIRIDPYPGIDEASLRLFVLGSAMGAALLQRGLLVLHGNAVVRDGVAAVALGSSGAGKSTLAEALRRQGFTVLADDVVVIDPALRVLAGIPRIKLWHDVTEHWAMDRAAMPRVRPNLEKYALNLVDTPPPPPAPVRRIYVLETEHIDAVQLAPVVGFERFKLLRLQAFRPRFLDALGQRAQHLRLATRLANQVPMARLIRPKTGFSAEALARLVADDLA